MSIRSETLTELAEFFEEERDLLPHGEWRAAVAWVATEVRRQAVVARESEDKPREDEKPSPTYVFCAWRVYGSSDAHVPREQSKVVLVTAPTEAEAVAVFLDRYPGADPQVQAVTPFRHLLSGDHLIFEVES